MWFHINVVSQVLYVRRYIKILSLLILHGQSNENVFVIPARNTRAADRPKFKTKIYEN